MTVYWMVLMVIKAHFNLLYTSMIKIIIYALCIAFKLSCSCFPDTFHKILLTLFCNFSSFKRMHDRVKTSNKALNVCSKSMDFLQSLPLVSSPGS